MPAVPVDDAGLPAAPVAEDVPAVAVVAGAPAVPVEADAAAPVVPVVMLVPVVPVVMVIPMDVEPVAAVGGVAGLPAVPEPVLAMGGPGATSVTAGFAQPMAAAPRTINVLTILMCLLQSLFTGSRAHSIVRCLEALAPWAAATRSCRRA